MKQLYYIFAAAYLFIVLTSYALDDLFGIDKGIFAFIFIFAFLYLLDIIIETYLHKKAGTFTLKQGDRLKMALFAGGIWTGLEVLFLAIDILISAPSYFIENLGIIFHPMFFVSGLMIGIAVYSSLGYGHVRNKIVNADPPPEPTEAVNPHLKNRQTRIDIAKAISDEKERIKREPYE